MPLCFPTINSSYPTEPNLPSCTLTTYINAALATPGYLPIILTSLFHQSPRKTAQFCRDAQDIWPWLHHAELWWQRRANSWTFEPNSAAVAASQLTSCKALQGESGSVWLCWDDLLPPAALLCRESVIKASPVHSAALSWVNTNQLIKEEVAKHKSKCPKS